MPEVRIDRKKRLRDEPATGHHRWHPDIPPDGQEQLLVHDLDLSRATGLHARRSHPAFYPA